ncbi:Surface antigen [Thalassospira xiamenensis]|jgi:surface antigen|uniref:Surface antigen n=2 Tax=Thalassospiraceae TaxID=2844866 RepID=A0A285TWT9_9PROT|nr:Surface antigen [Thalassospira xiamenensis]
MIGFFGVLRKRLFKTRRVTVPESGPFKSSCLLGEYRMRLAVVIGFCMLVSGCFASASTPKPNSGLESDGVSTVTNVSLPSSRLLPFAPTDEFLQCVPYARAVSGIEIYGDAWTWWDQAKNTYSRGKKPEVGAVLALKKTSRLKYGHVAVVAAILDSRKIMVNHANWGSDSRTRGKVHYRQPVVDVSPNNDWSEVRMMNTIGTFGRVYPAHGFIYQPHETAEAH